MVVSSILERRVEALESTSRGSGGCERCSGVLVVVSNAVTGEFHSATWRGEAMTEGEVQDHQSRRECPGCGRKLDPEEAPVIRIGGLRGRS
jgi:hypothetical protein